MLVCVNAGVDAARKQTTGTKSKIWRGWNLYVCKTKNCTGGKHQKWGLQPVISSLLWLIGIYLDSLISLFALAWCNKWQTRPSWVTRHILRRHTVLSKHCFCKCFTFPAFIADPSTLLGKATCRFCIWKGLQGVTILLPGQFILRQRLWSTLWLLQLVSNEASRGYETNWMLNFSTLFNS